MVFLAFLIEIISLFFLSRILTSLLSKFIVSVVRSKNITIWLLSLLFLPGVVIHELSHLIMASILFVHAGEVEFIPKITGNNVKLGSVQIEKTDFIRRSLIGFAPLIVGVFVLLSIFYYFLPNVESLSNIFGFEFLLSLYAIFQISNTMFSSRKDIEGAFKLIIVLLSALFILVIVKSDFILYLIKKLNESQATPLTKNIDLFLLIPLTLDILFIFLLKLALRNKYLL